MPGLDLLSRRKDVRRKSRAQRRTLVGHSAALMTWATIPRVPMARSARRWPGGMSG